MKRSNVRLMNAILPQFPQERKYPMYTMIYPVALACAGLYIGCAAANPPPPRIAALQGSAQATAAQVQSPAPELRREAHTGPAVAGNSLRDDPQPSRTSEIADVASRSAERAEALPALSTGRTAKAKADRDFWEAQAKIAREKKAAPFVSERRASPAVETRVLARNTISKAEERTADAQAEFTTLATVREESRGAIITLSGKILFAFDQSAILPKARDQLSRVADALLALKDRTFTVCGYTDASDSPDRNQGLSQARAYAVRLFLISRGCSAELIHVQESNEGGSIAGSAGGEGSGKSPGVEIVINRIVK